MGKFICIRCHKSFDKLTDKNFSLCEKCLDLKIISKNDDEKDNICPQCMGSGKIHLK